MDTPTLGCFYLMFYYPSTLHLQESKPYEFQHNGKSFYIVIKEQIKAVRICDFDNELFTTKDEAGRMGIKLAKTNFEISDKAMIAQMGSGLVYAIEYSSLKYRDYHNKDYRRVFVIFETSKEKENKLQIARAAFNNFIRAYQSVSQDIWATELRKDDFTGSPMYEYFHTYDQSELEMTSKDRVLIERSILPGIKQLQPPLPGKYLDVSTDDVTKMLSDLLERKQKPSVVSELVFRARQELELNNNYKYSFFESWQVIEISVSEFLRTKKLVNGVNKNRLEELESEVPIAYLLDVEMYWIFPNMDEGFIKLLSKIKGIKSKRNDVVHRNAEVSQKEAENAFATAIEFIQRIGYKINKVKNSVPTELAAENSVDSE